MGEAQQAIGKILRHGYASYNPDKIGAENGPNNRDDLTKELGDVEFAIEMMLKAGDINEERLNCRMAIKAEKIKSYLHHQLAPREGEKASSG